MRFLCLFVSSLATVAAAWFTQYDVNVNGQLTCHSTPVQAVQVELKDEGFFTTTPVAETVTTTEGAFTLKGDIFRFCVYKTEYRFPVEGIDKKRVDLDLSTIWDNTKMANSLVCDLPVKMSTE